MNINVTKDNVTIDEQEQVHKGEYNVTDLNFIFSEEYTGLSKMAVFSNAYQTYEVAITNNSCIIPHEVLVNRGILTIGVYGYTIEDNIVVKRYSPTPITITIANGSYKRGLNAQAENPTLFEEFVEQIETDFERFNDSKQDKLIEGDNIEIVGSVINAIVPTDNTELTNGAGYITKDVNNLTNYTKTSDFNEVAFTGSYEDLTQTPTKVSDFLNDENYQTYDEVQEQISALGSVFTLKGTVNTVADLPQTNNKQGDVWYVKSESAGYVWLNDNGTYRWEILGYTVDTSDFLTKSGLDQSTGQDTENTMSQKAITDQLNTKQATINSSNKLSADLVNDTSSTNKFVTSAEKETWNNKSDFSGNYNDLTNKPDLTIYEEKTDAQTKYDTLLDQIPTNTTTDTLVNIQDSSNLPIKEFDLLGNATQVTTSTAGGDEYDSPSPDHPQDIHVVTGDNTLVKVGKNLLNASALNASPNVSSITFQNDILTITASGTYTSGSIILTDLIKNNAGQTLRYHDDGRNNTDGVASIQLVIDKYSTTSKEYNYVSTTPYNIPSDVSDIKKATFYIFQNNRGTPASGTLTVTRPMLYFGSTDDTVYTPYIAPTSKTIHLGSLELAKIGGYTDKLFKAVEGNSIYDSLDSTTKGTLTSGAWYKQGNIGKAIFTGGDSENWTISNSGTANWYYSLTGTGLIPISNTSTTSVALCNNYLPANIGNSNTYEGIILIASNGQIRIRYGTEDTTSNFKTWLASHNTIFYFVLATPTYTEITDTTLISQLENILAMHTNKNVTNAWIEPSGTNAQGGIKLVYRRDMQTIINNLQNQVDILST